MSDMVRMQQGFHRDMAQMQQGLHRDMAQLQRDLQSGASHVQRDMRQMQADLQRSAHQAQRETQHHARQVQREAQHIARQAQREARHRARQAQRELHNEHGGWAWPGARGNSWTSRSGSWGSVSTSVVNGHVYVNGQLVAQLPPGTPVSISTVNNEVHLNGQVIWPQGGGGVIHQSQRRSLVMPRPARAHQDGRSLAMRHSRIGVCDADREEPCPICLDEIRAGQHTRTLPCFHFLHQHCAESHFFQGENPEDAVLCPVCRAEVGPVQHGEEVVEVLSD